MVVRQQWEPSVLCVVVMIRGRFSVAKIVQMAISNSLCQVIVSRKFLEHIIRVIRKPVYGGLQPGTAKISISAKPEICSYARKHFRSP